MTGRRDRLVVDELLALVAVRGTPPIAVRIDPAKETTVIALRSVEVSQKEVRAATGLQWSSPDSPLEAALGAPVAARRRRGRAT